MQHSQHSQYSRRTNPYPFTWEIPAAVVVSVLLMVVLAAQTGRSLANALAGNGWVFVDRARLFSSLGGVLSGDAAAGLDGVSHPAGRPLLLGGVGVIEVLAVLGLVAVVRWGWTRWGPPRIRGMATRAEADTLLGMTRLREHAGIIRPDLYGPDRLEDARFQEASPGHAPGDDPSHDPSPDPSDDRWGRGVLGRAGLRRRARTVGS